ncbi:MAG: MutS-related protein [Bacteroidota bacterium]
MQDIITPYRQRIAAAQLQLKQIKKRLLLSSLLRLLLFGVLVFLMFKFWGETKWIVASLISGIVAFIILVNKHGDLDKSKKKIKALIALNKTEITVANGKYTHLPTGEQYKNPQHAYSQDIDLFGENSFFQYLNRSALKEGENCLAEKLTENNCEAILGKQAVIQDLTERIDFRQNFYAESQLIETEVSTKSIIEWVSNYKAFVPSFMRWIPKVFSVLSLLVLLAFFTGFISGLQLLLWFFIGLVITSVFVKKVNLLSTYINQAQNTFQQYYKLLKAIEDEEFSAPMAKQFQEKTFSEKQKASAIIRSFSKRIDAFEQRSNFLLGVFLNAFLLWDIQQSYKIEKWIDEHQNSVKDWFEIIAEFDAYNSLANFAYNHPNYTYPKLADKNSNVLLEASKSVHPLIDAKDAVRNDFSIKNNEFFIITGANMAGKSTFLRTVSLQILMSNIGLPVCAEKSAYRPIKLITSMRTVDSLADEASYFYAELTRLKHIVDEIKNERYFIVLDEILKGTNSTDKAIGSRKFVERLVKSNSVGIIATHDLSLCEVAEEMPQVKNYYFDAEIKNDELYFDYTLKQGICQNMNASFLLRKMDIIDD